MARSQNHRRTRAWTVLSTALLLGAAGDAGAQNTAAPACRAERIAFVLSGGGAKGYAHVGVLRVLDSLGVRPDLIVGTSMGALVGAVYASGTRGRGLDSLARTLPLDALIHPLAARVPVAFGSLVSPSRPWNPTLVWESGNRGLRLQSPAVREDAVDTLLTGVLLHGNLHAAGDFDRLPIPLRVVAADLISRQRVVLDHGDLAHAVRASIAIPVVFTPVQLDGRTLVDGGLAANIPIAVARAAGATRLIVSDVSSHETPDSLGMDSPLSMANYLVDLLFEQPADSLGPADVVIRPDVADASTLDFSPDAIEQHIEAGYAAAADAMRSARAGCLASATHLVTDSTSSVQTPLAPGEHRVRQRVGALAASGAVRAVWLDPGRQGDSLTLAPIVAPSPRHMAAVKLRYDNQQGGAIEGAAQDNVAIGGRAEAGIGTMVGEWRQEATLRLRTAGAHRSALWGEVLPDPRSDKPPWNQALVRRVRASIRLLGAHERVRRFDGEGVELTPPVVYEITAFAGADLDNLGGWYGTLGPFARWWRVELPGDLGGGIARPSAVGGLLRVGRIVWRDRPVSLPLGPGVWVGEWQLTDSYRRAEMVSALPFQSGHLTLRPVIVLGTGSSLPPQQTFVLGGEEGFPGLQFAERRGDRTASASLLALWRLRGPVSLLAEFAAGAVATGGHALPTTDWLGGASFGIRVTTAVGPMRVSYGRVTLGRGAMLVSLGR